MGRRPGPAILMYHRIARPGWDPWELAVSPTNFEAHLIWLKRRRVVLPLEEFAELNRRNRLPANAVAVTFDDGYACNAQIAAPLAASCNAALTIFLTTGAISAEHEFWWDDLERIVTAAGESPEGCTLAGQTVAFEPEQDLTQRYLTLWRALRPLNHAARHGAIMQLAQEWGVETAARHEYRAMTAAEVGDLARSPWVSFGAHSVNHPPLSELSVAEQRMEIEMSRDACARLTGARPTLFAYPYGDYDDQTVELVREAGFDTAVTTDAGFVGRSSASLRLPRLHVGDWPEEKLASLLAGDT